MSNNQYHPIGLWQEYDFLVNKHYWSKQGYDASINIRKKNLRELTQMLTSSGINYWLQGQTLKGIFTENELPDDHDDDIGIWLEDTEKLLKAVKPILEENGFMMIRNNADIVSFARDYRYIDICIFHKVNANIVQYAQKSFPAAYYHSFEPIVTFDDNRYIVPSQAALIIKHLYAKRFPKVRALTKRLLSLSGAILEYHSRKHINHKIQAILLAKIAQRTILSKILLLLLGPMFDIRLVKLTKEDFESLNIEPKHSYNWIWRIKHLGLVTDNGKYQNISGLVKYLSNNTTQDKIQAEVIESNMHLNFKEPLNLDMDFWWSGNNYFWYCIKYKFRKNVVSYANGLEYIKQKNGPALYSAEYYEQLTEMSEAEIETFLRQHPIEILNGSIIGGKHRAFAMIGRMISNQPYLTVYALSASSKY